MKKLALLGCGRISAKHVEAIKEVKGLSLVACCDINQTKAQVVAERTGCHCFNDAEKMLREANIDLVSICTPSGLHPEHATLVASFGKHVITEKPLGCSVKACKEAIRACDVAKVRLFVVKQNRFNPAIKLLRRAFEAGRFGKLYMILANVLWSRPQSYYDEAPWRGTWSLDGGCLSNQASHYVDLVQWFGGNVADVKATAATQARKIEAEDTISLSIDFESGAVGNINATTLTYPKNLEGSLTLIGEKGTARVGGTSLNKLELWEFDSEHVMDDAKESVDTCPPTVYGHGHHPFYEHVLRVLEGNEEMLTDGMEAIKTVEIVEMAYKSAAKKY